MRLNKTFFTVIFSISFLIGITAFYLIPKFEKNTQQVENLQTTPLNFPSEIIQIKSESKLIEDENNDWENDDESKFKAKLLETGEGFHGDEIKAKSGESWLGLYRENDNYFLRSTKIKIRRSIDGIIDDIGEKTGKDVIVDSKTNPIFLVKNAKVLKASKVKTAFYNSSDEDSTSLENGFIENYEINDNKYTLRVEGEINSSKLILEIENKKQILFAVDKMGDTTWNLIWVGDLDGDGKLDVYADLPTFYNFSEKRLFLSSQAENNKLIKQVAVFHTSGC